MKIGLIPALLLAGAACSTNVSAAAMQAQMRQNVAFGVIDLTPSDGNAASWSISDMSTDYLLRFTSATDPTRVRTYTSTGTTADQLDASYYGASSSAVFSGTPGNFSLQSYGPQTLGINGSASATITQTMTITLSPRTILTLDANLYTESTVLDGVPAHFKEEYRSNFDIAWGSTNQTYWDEGPPDGVETAHRWLAYANSSDESRNIVVTLSTMQRVTVRAAPTVLAPVPEPSTWGMLLAGLCVTGIVARRRAKGPLTNSRR